MRYRAALVAGCGPLCLMALAGCEPADNQPGVGDVTVGEARALNEAAEMLDNRSLTLPAENAATPTDTATSTR